MQKKIHRMNRSLIPACNGLILVLIWILSLTSNASAASVNLAWDASPDLYVVGYNVYRSLQSGVFASAPLNSTPVAMTSFTDASLQSGTYYYIVRAVGLNGAESLPSNELQVIIDVSNSAPVVSAGVYQAI